MEKLTKFCELVHYTDKDGKGEYIKNLEKLLSISNAAKDFITSADDINIIDTINEIQNLIKEKCELKLPSDAPHNTFLEKIS